MLIARSEPEKSSYILEPNRTIVALGLVLSLTLLMERMHVHRTI
jgi:hypothetical protein